MRDLAAFGEGFAASDPDLETTEIQIRFVQTTSTLGMAEIVRIARC